MNAKFFPASAERQAETAHFQAFQTFPVATLIPAITFRVSTISGDHCASCA
jgi:hypothetical protein